MKTGTTSVPVAAPALPGTLRRTARVCRAFILSAAVGLAIGLIALVTLPSVFGYQSLTVVSGSMEPTLGVGSVVIDEVISPLDARPGDIVTFQDPLHPRQLTHRLQRMRVDGDTAYMVTLGDANDAPERWTVKTDKQISSVVTQLPKLSYARAALGTRYARLGVMGEVLGRGAFLLVDMWRPRRRVG